MVNDDRGYKRYSNLDVTGRRGRFIAQVVVNTRQNNRMNSHNGSAAVIPP